MDGSHLVVDQSDISWVSVKPDLDLPLYIQDTKVCPAAGFRWYISKGYGLAL